MKATVALEQLKLGFDTTSAIGWFTMEGEDSSLKYDAGTFLRVDQRTEEGGRKERRLSTIL